MTESHLSELSRRRRPRFNSPVLRESAMFVNCVVGQLENEAC